MQPLSTQMSSLSQVTQKRSRRSCLNKGEQIKKGLSTFPEIQQDSQGPLALDL